MKVIELEMGITFDYKQSQKQGIIVDMYEVHTQRVYIAHNVAQLG